MTIPTIEEFADRWTLKAKEKGADPSALLESQAKNVRELAGSVITALKGGEREQLHLKAQFSQGVFMLEAEAYLEFRAWRDALIEVIEEVFSAMLDAGVKAVGKALVSSLREGLA